MASEIATQYILLLLVEMKSSHMLRLPYRANEIIPPKSPDCFPPPSSPPFWRLPMKLGLKSRGEDDRRR